MNAETIFNQLEYLKYVGSLREPFAGEKGSGPIPTGEGIPIEIVMLPSILLDVRAQNILDPDSFPGRATVVGGRAARAACALLHLQDDYDGTYGVRLITRTGNLGRLLLESEFHDHRTGRPSRRLDAEFVFERPGEPRCALWKTSDGRPISRQHQVDDELRVEHIEESPAAVRAIKEARTIYLGSYRIPKADELLRYVVGTMGEQATLFVDTSRTTEEQCDQLVRLAAELCPDRAVIFAIVAEPGQPRAEPGKKTRRARKSEPAKWVRSTIRDLHREGVACPTVIEYGSATHAAPAEVRLRRPGARHKPVSAEARFLEEDIREYFKAGVVLAHSLCQTIRGPGVPLSEGMREQFLSSWSTSAHGLDIGPEAWQAVIGFGVQLARARAALGDGGPASADGNALLRALVSLDASPESDHVPGDESDPLDTDADLHPVQITSKRKPVRPSPDQADIRHLARLAGHRRSGDGLKSYKLPFCDPIKCPSGCPRQAAGDREDVPAAVMIDLDGTLLDSTEQRAKGLTASLSVLAENDILPHDCRDVAEALEFFSTHVYDPWPVFSALGLGDFRQQWNLPAWYVTYIALGQRENGGLARAITGLGKRLPERAAVREARRLLPGEKWVSRFWTEYGKALDRDQDKVAEAMEAFWSVRMRPLKEARDFLHSLRRSGAFGLYVVSEGDPQTQWRKIQQTGLDEFFEQQRVLTTGDAAEPTIDRQGLAGETALVQRELTETQLELEQLRCRHEELARIQMDIDVGIQLEGHQTAVPRDVIDEHIAQLKNEIVTGTRRERGLRESVDAVRLVDRVLTRMSRKGGISFYAAAIRAILRDPKFPLSALKNFSRLLAPVDEVDEKARIKVAMIGDRQSADVEPPVRLLSADQILTIRLNSGKYATDEPVSEMWPQPPRYVADTLAQAKTILLTHQAWQDTKCTADPRIFCLTIDTARPDVMPDEDGWEGPQCAVGLNHVLCGVSMDPDEYEVVHRICFEILWEHLVHSQPDERAALLTPFLGVPDDEDPYSGLYRRVRLLCAFAKSDHAMRSRVLSDSTKAGIRARLRADLELLEGADDDRLREAGCGDTEALLKAAREAIAAPD